jgi:hypothetical protein
MFGRLTPRVWGLSARISQIEPERYRSYLDGYALLGLTHCTKE